jgi:integrase
MKKIRRGLWFDGKREARFEVSVPGTAGKRRRRLTVPASTRAEAESLYKAFRDRVLSGQDDRPAAIPTFKGYTDQHWPIGEINSASQKSQTSSLEVSVLPFFGAMRLDAINGATVKDFRQQLKTKGYATPTINTRVRLVRKIINDAYDREVLPTLPRKWPRALPEQQLRNEATDAEQKAFLEAFEDRAGYASLLALEGQRGGFQAFGGERAVQYLYELFRGSKPLFIAAFETGLSRSDLLALELKSVDLEGGLIRVQRRKTGAWSTIPISEACRDALLEARSRRMVSSTYVFVTAEGRPYSVSTITRYFSRAKRLAKIGRRFRFHDIRHSFGSNLASRGVPALVIKMAMGHNNIRTTERYARANEAAVKDHVLTALNRSS